MQGLIRKELFIFFKSFETKVILVILGACAFVVYNLGLESGPVISMMLALLVGLQNTMSFANDEKVRWNQYQLAMPVSSLTSVSSKYIAVAITLGFSFLGSMALNLAVAVVYGTFVPSIWVVSGIISVMVPLLWTGVSLLLAYWFGFQSSRFLSIFVVVPMSYFITSFGEESGFPVLADFIHSFALIAGIGTAIFFVLSMMISVAGYRRRK